MKKKKLLIIGISTAAALLIALAVVLAVTMNNNAGGEKMKEFNLSSNLAVSDVFFYSGEFVEDGSNEKVKDVASVKLKNTGDKDYEYVEFEVTTGNTVYHFKASTVLHGSTVTLINTEKKKLEKKDTVKSVNLIYCADYILPLSLHEDVFTLYPYDKTINIRNTSGKDIAGDVVVYYKDKDENGFFGGITYRVVFTGMKNGETKQKVSEHFGEVVNITYDK